MPRTGAEQAVEDLRTRRDQMQDTLDELGREEARLRRRLGEIEATRQRLTAGVDRLDAMIANAERPA